MPDPSDKIVEPPFRKGPRAAVTNVALVEVSAEPPVDCPDCAANRARVQELLQQRDDVLLALARERERTNALLFGGQRPSEPRAASDLPPGNLRYRVVDLVNTTLKTRTPAIHGTVKKLAVGVRNLGARLLGGK